MPDVAPWLTLVTALAACAGAASATMANVYAAQQARARRQEKRWWDEKEKLTLIAVAEYADGYALEGAAQPGTQAVRTLYPGFDFTMGGKYPDRPLRDTPNVMYAPWPQQMAESLAEYQESGTLHPYLCEPDRRHGALLVDTQGWRCPVCSYTQRWALRYHADGTWRRDKARLVGVFREPPSPARRRSPWIEFARRRLGLFLTTAPAPEKTSGEDTTRSR